jgi:Tol biopolymer transport system component
MNTLKTKVFSLILAIIVVTSAAAIAPAQQVDYVSRNFAGTGSGDRQSMLFTDGYRHSALGRYVGFLSSASNVIQNGPFVITPQLYVRDLKTARTQLITADYQTGDVGNCGSSKFEFSKDGRYLAFASCDSNLMPGTPDKSARLFLRDMQTGTLKVVDVAIPGPNFYGQYWTISLSDDGKKLAFPSLGYNVGLPYDRNHLEDVYVYDIDSGQTSLVSVDRYGVRAGNGVSHLLQISGNGRYVLFASYAGNLVDEAIPAGGRNFYVRDLVAGTTKLVTVTMQGTGAHPPETGDLVTSGHRGRISEDGRYVTFLGALDEFTANDHNGHPDLFQRDMVAGTTTLISVNSTGTNSGDQGADSAYWTADYSVTPDGRYVAFYSRSTDLVLSDDNQHGDCFVRDMLNGTTRRIGGQIPRTGVYSDLLNPYISANGRYVSFEIDEQFPDTATQISLYCYDSVTNQLTDLSAPNGQYIGWLIGGGFSDDSRMLVFTGPAAILPNDSNNDYDVFVMTLDGATIRPRPVALSDRFGE